VNAVSECLSTCIKSHAFQQIGRRSFFGNSTVSYYFETNDQKPKFSFEKGQRIAHRGSNGLRNSEVKPLQFLLDPNNHFFHDLVEYSEIKKLPRYQEPGVRRQPLKLLRDTTAFDLVSLEDSIRTNGYIQVEQIIVAPYNDGPDGKNVIL
jgi:hypothetical protein